MIRCHGQEPIFERSEAAHMRKLGPRGKKLTTHDQEKSMDSKNGKGADGGGTSKISGATYSDGICDFEREGDHKNVKCYKGDKSSKPRKFKMAGFVTFTNDYHGPKHHLPKHN